MHCSADLKYFLLHRFCWLCMAVLWCFNATAQSPKILLTDKQGEVNITGIAYISDSSCAYHFEEVSAASFQHRFSLSTAAKNAFNADIFCYWIKFEAANNTGKEGEWLIDFPGWTNVECYMPDSAGSYAKKITGHMVPFNKRDFPIANRNLVRLHLQPGETKLCYARLYSGVGYMIQPDRLSFSIDTKSFVLEYEYKIKNILYFFTGIYIVMLLYNFFVYLSIKEKSYLYYLFILLFLQIIIIEDTGYNMQLFRSIEYYPAWISKIDLITSSLFGFSLFLFTRHFLQTKRNQPVMDKIFTGVMIILVIVPVPGFFGYVFQATNLSSLSGLITMAVLFIASIKSCVDRYPASGFFLMAYSAMLAGIFIYLSWQLDLLPHTWFTEFSIQIGSCIGIVLFSFALSNSINILKKQNAEKQLQIIRQLEENTALQSKVNLELEQKVEERTKEIKEFQKQLIQQEKLASLGELTAGIAHEIQNPLNFVNNFADVNNELLSELKEELEKGNSDIAKTLADDAMENGQKILHHGRRAEAIVKCMLQHSRANVGEKIPADINALADEYLRLSYHGLRAKDKSFNAYMHTDFDQGIGKINVVGQDIGRVLLNLYNNAFYAVTDKKTQMGDTPQPDGRHYDPTVSVSTKKINDRVEIRVRDNGNGIPQKVLDKIFHPFFTTKPTGQGTGLGLSISYDIIKAHHGEIEVNTKEGQFTEFIISLAYQKST